MANYANPDDSSGVIRNWMSNQNSFAFYSLWEELNNPDFNSVESHGINNSEVPYNRFTMTPNRWKKDFNAIYADLLHLIILNNLENINAELIEMGMKQQERLVRLNNSGKKQIELLQHNENIAKLETNKRS